jgi:coniferyl-aldehyde dehydrogenase
VVPGETANLSRAASLLAFGKMLNGGQLCLAPDYVLVPRQRRRDLIDGLVREAGVMFPRIHDNPDQTGIISPRHFARLNEYVDDARRRGAEVLVVNPASQSIDAAKSLRIPLHIVLDATASSVRSCRS